MAHLTPRSFYHDQAQAYFDQTFRIDPSSFLQPLTKYLHQGATILDVGCGSGRDMLWLQSRGFSCTGLDCSPQLADLARRHTGLPVIEADFETFDFCSLDMDAVLLVGALVHVPHKRFRPVLQRTLCALKSQGVVLMTLKQGQCTETRPDGRVFYLWQKRDICKIITGSHMLCVEYFEQRSKIRERDLWMGFVARKQQSPKEK